MRLGGHALCDLHNAQYCEYKRVYAGRTELEVLIEQQKKDMGSDGFRKLLGARTGGAVYRGFIHLTEDDPGFGEPRSPDHFMQLIEHLSGTLDRDGVLIPHPFDCVV